MFFFKVKKYIIKILTFYFFSSVYVKENIAVVHVFFEKQGFLKKTRGKIYDELVKNNYNEINTNIKLRQKGCTLFLSFNHINIV